jgi:hypothetical protein
MTYIMTIHGMTIHAFKSSLKYMEYAKVTYFRFRARVAEGLWEEGTKMCFKSSE